MPEIVDILVVGGGPVGLATAIEARLAGLSVVLLEPRRGPVDKACGEGLMPGAVAALDRLGVRPAGRTLAGIRYLDEARSVTHLFANGPGLGVRRTVLHAALAERARELGVVPREIRVDRVTQSPDAGERGGASGARGTVEAGGVRARWLLACDGLHSPVRRLTGLEPTSRERTRHRRYGLRRHFRVEPWADVVEVHWADHHEAYVTPVADDTVGVAILGPAGLRFDDALAAVPAVADRLRGAGPASDVRGAGPLRQRSTARGVGRVLLVGDASGYVDALTGEGLRVGFAQARAAVASVLAGGTGYGRAWDDATRDYRVLTSGLVAAAASPLRGAIVPLAAAVPSLFGAAVERLSR